MGKIASGLLAWRNRAKSCPYCCLTGCGKTRLRACFGKGTSLLVPICPLLLSFRGGFSRRGICFSEFFRNLLGDVRCVVMDVTPRPTSGSSRFFGRMWVEDQDFNIVRFMGTYTSKSLAKYSFHFDSWRLNVMPRLWLPAFVYTEESDPNQSSSRGIRFKAQTRLWGYDLQHAGDHKEY